MDVFWLNHSITFLPTKATSVGSLYYLTCCRGIVGYRNVTAVLELRAQPFQGWPEDHALMQDTGPIRQFRPYAGHTKELDP
jgi:hypothetical protein